MLTNATQIRTVVVRIKKHASILKALVNVDAPKGIYSMKQSVLVSDITFWDYVLLPAH